MQLEVCYSSDYEGTARYKCNLKFIKIFLFSCGAKEILLNSVYFVCSVTSVLPSLTELQVDFVVPLIRI